MAIQDEVAKQSKVRSYKVEIGDNFETDISNKILSISINKRYNGDTYLLSDISPDEASLTVKNPSNYFSNIDLENKKIRIFAGYNGVWIERFRGFLRKGGYSVRTKEYTLTAESYLNIFKKEIINKEMLENLTVNQILQRCFSEVGLAYTDYDLQNTKNPIIPIVSLSDYNTWNEVLRPLLESIIANIQWNGTLQKFIVKDFYNETYPSQHKFTVSNISDFKTEFSKDFVKNKIVITSNYLAKGNKDKVTDQYPQFSDTNGEIYTIQEGLNNRIKVKNYPLYKHIEGGLDKYKEETIVTVISGNNIGTQIPVSDMDELNGYIYLSQNLATGIMVSVNYKFIPVALIPDQERDFILDKKEKAKNLQIICTAFKDLLVRSSQNQINGAAVPYSNTVIANAICLVSFEEKEDRVKIRLKNTTTESIVIADLFLMGDIIKSYNPIDVRFKHLDSIAKYGEKEVALENNFLTSSTQAINYGQLLYSNMYEAIYRLNIPSTSLLPHVELGKVEVVESSTNTNGFYLLTQISDNMQENSWDSQVTAIPYPTILPDASAYWVQADASGEIIGNPLFNDKIPDVANNLVVYYKQSVGQPTGIYDIAFTWNYPLDQKNNPIEGFIFQVKASNTNDQFAYDKVAQKIICSPQVRGVVLYNMPLKETIDEVDLYKYYGACLIPYRNVHPEISPDSTGILTGEISYFSTIYKKIDEFTIFNGTTIEDSVNGVIETTSVSILNNMLKSFEKDRQYDNSIMFSDFSGFKQYNAGKLIKQWGQIAPGIYGEVQYNGDGEEVFKFDGQKLFLNAELQVGTTVKKADGTSIPIEDVGGGVQFDTQYNGVVISTTNGVQVKDAYDVEKLKMGGLGNSEYGFKSTHDDLSYSQMSGKGFFRYVNVSTSSNSVSLCTPTSIGIRISNYKDFVVEYSNGVVVPTPITLSYNGVSETVNINEIELHLYSGEDTAWLYFAPGSRPINTYPSGSLVTQDLTNFPKTYFYLSYIGVVSNEGVIESNSSTPPLTMWIDLPKEFRGKPFKVIAMPSVFDTTRTQVEALVIDYDYTNGKFQVRACTWNASTSQYQGIKFTYIAIV